MRGMMMDFPLSVPAIIRRADTLFPDKTIVTRRADRSITRSTYGSVVERARRLSVALTQLGVRPGDRVATLAWNHQRHLEAYLAVPAMRAVLHTLNLRFHADDLAYIINDAADSIVLVDAALLPLIESVRSRVSIEHVVVMSDDATEVAGAIDYEQLLQSVDPARFVDCDIDEGSAAAMCYTTGTTGQPKGVVYSHRAVVLHSLAHGLRDTLDMGEADTVLPVVPMFHVNAWGLPFSATLFGSSQVLPGPHLDPHSLLELMSDEAVTLTSGVPTVWLGVLAALDAEPGRYNLQPLRMILSGGSAAPPAMIRGFEERHGVRVVHGWGMTEMTPFGSVCTMPSRVEKLPADLQWSYRAAQGTPMPFVEIRATANGMPVPWDGCTMGELEVRGPWVAAAYYNGSVSDDRFTSDGWFKTGDIVTIGQFGCIQITDRSKDLVKSGGEWISSVALEGALMGHPAVAEAAVVAVPHPKWGERPLAVVVLKKGCCAESGELIEHVRPHFPKWWVPDSVEFVTEIPRTSTGKFKKSVLRDRYRTYYPSPDAAL